MVRKCCVSDCNETDATILAHRFPKSQEVSSMWQRILQIEDSFSLDDLMKTKVVCTRHFSASAYRNEISNALNTNSLPNLCENNDNERIFTTKERNKNRIFSNLRVHKMPEKESTSLLKMNQIVKEPAMKKPKLQPIEIHKIEAKKRPVHNVIVAEQEIEVPSSEDVILDEEQIEIRHEEDYPNETIIQSVDDSSQSLDHNDDHDFDDNVANADDEIIKLIHPEYQNMSRLDLINIIIEQNEKIKTLTDKEETMKKAMRELIQNNPKRENISKSKKK
jgi:hypothetical protein